MAKQTKTVKNQSAVISALVWSNITKHNEVKRDYYEALESVDACAHVALWAQKNYMFSCSVMAEVHATLSALNLYIL